MNFNSRGKDPSLRDEVSRAKQGDRDAFAIIVTQLDRRLLAACYRACFGHHEYEDVAIKVWLEVWTALPAFYGTTAEDIRKFAIDRANLRSIDFHRKRKKSLLRELPTYDDGKTDEPVSLDLPQLNKMVLLEESEAIRNCIESKANADALNTWRMKKIEGMSYDEIMEALSIKKGAVGSRINRVEKIIAGCMEGREL